MTSLAPMLDPAVLAELADVVGDEVVPELLQAFAIDLDKAHGKARTAVAQCDPAGFAAAMHSLRGSCAYFGAVALGAVASRFIAAAGCGDLDAAWSTVAPILVATQAAVADFGKETRDA